jgi:ABC transporter substrate binding protein
MRRRDFNTGLLIGSAAMQPLLAQQSTEQRRLAIVAAGGRPENISDAGSRSWRAFFWELGRLGHFEGRDLIIERYSAEGQPGRYTDLAREVVSINPDVIVVAGNPLARVFRPWAGTTPIVANMADPLATGMVQSLARPGGHLTGVSEDAGIEIWGKRVQLLKEAVPLMARLTYVGAAGANGRDDARNRERGSTIGPIRDRRFGRRTQSRRISSIISSSRRAVAGCSCCYLRVWRWDCSTCGKPTLARHLSHPLLHRSWWAVSLWMRSYRNCPTDCQRRAPNPCRS